MQEEKEESHSEHERAARSQAPVVAYIAALGAGAVALGLVLASADLRPPGRSATAALPFLGGLLIAAEYLFVRYRFRGSTNALNVVEAALAPLIFAFEPQVAMLTVAAAQTVAETLRRNAPVKASFNVAQWTLAAGAGSATLAAVAGGTTGIHGRTIVALLAAQAVVAAVNHLAFTFVLAIANGQSPRKILLSSVMIPHWAAPWVMNSLTGILFILAYHAHPAAVTLFPIPLIVLHLAYRGYAGARSDRVRLAGLHQAAQALSEPLDPQLAIEPYLREVARCFEARAAALVFQSDDGWTIHRYDGATGTRTVAFEPLGTPSLEGALLAQPTASRATVTTGGALARALQEAGWTDCLSAPLMEEGRITGALLVYDQAGLEGFEAGEVAVIEALARETVGVFAKGRLVEEQLEERRRLSEIVGSSSDGICTIDRQGTVTSWNPAMERITGISADEIVERQSGLAAFQPRTATDDRVDLAGWASGDQLPSDLRYRRGADVVYLACSYSHALGPDGQPSTLIMIARDVTGEIEMRALRERVGRLAEAEAAQRNIVEQLQQAVMPPRPPVAGVELGVSYLSSDPSSPTGGDLYDWHALPSGELHLAVVDVLGHGVAATQDALAVVHALRLLALQGCPLEHMVERADGLLTQRDRDLVATVVVARYEPETGRLRLAGGGHPPPLLLQSSGAVAPIPLAGGAIGWPNAGSRGTTEVTLEPNDALVLYTDGLVESRRNIIEGTDTLARHAHELMDLSAESLAGQLVHRALADADRRDDSLALVLRHAPAPAQLERASWRIPPDRLRVHEIRRELGRWLAARGIESSAVKDLELIAGELLANAVVAGRSTIAMRTWMERDVVMLEVEDDGVGREDLGSSGLHHPASDAETGRGLFIVRALTDEVTILSTVEGTIIRCARRLSAAPSSPSRPSAGGTTRPHASRR